MGHYFFCTRDSDIKTFIRIVIRTKWIQIELLFNKVSIKPAKYKIDLLGRDVTHRKSLFDGASEWCNSKVFALWPRGRKLKFVASVYLSLVTAWSGRFKLGFC